MAQSRTQYADMKSEILTDPLVRNYAGMTHLQVLASLNLLNRSRNKTSMTGREVKAQVVDAQYDVLTDGQKSQFLALTSSDDLDPFGLPANVIKDIFGPAATTTTNLATARVETVSRLTELKLGDPVLGNIIDARS